MTPQEIHEQFLTLVDPHLPFRAFEWLNGRGFFSAPASTKYHGNYSGGLHEHSLNVMNALVSFTKNYHLQWQREESPYIVGYFHDLCKIDQYQDGREFEGDSPSYVYRNDMLFKGHGVKSVLLLSTLTQLTEEEVACIVYHMGAFTDKEEWGSYTGAIHKYPNVLWTHTADMIASHIMEV